MLSCCDFMRVVDKVGKLTSALPVLIVHGDGDGVTPLSNVIELEQRMSEGHMAACSAPMHQARLQHTLLRVLYSS